jgi:hypothetical protein
MGRRTSPDNAAPIGFASEVLGRGPAFCRSNPAKGSSGDLRGLSGDEQDQQHENDDGEEHAVSIPQGVARPLIDKPDINH